MRILWLEGEAVSCSLLIGHTALELLGLDVEFELDLMILKCLNKCILLFFKLCD